MWVNVFLTIPLSPFLPFYSSPILPLDHHPSPANQHHNAPLFLEQLLPKLLYNVLWILFPIPQSLLNVWDLSVWGRLTRIMQSCPEPNAKELVRTATCWLGLQKPHLFFSCHPSPSHFITCTLSSLTITFHAKTASYLYLSSITTIFYALFDVICLYHILCSV